MSPPQPMLSVSSRSWPVDGGWVLQPKWDGYRLLIEVGVGGRIRAWSRHGTSLGARLGDLLGEFSASPAGSVFDGELVAIGERDGRPVQDFAAVGRAVFAGDAAAVAQLRFVAFDVLELDRLDLRGRPWRERDQQLRAALPASELVRPIRSLPASPGAHREIVALGFEGTVLKRRMSLYRPGRHSMWLKHKARHATRGVLRAVRQDREGRWYEICDVAGRRVAALTGATAADQLGEPVVLVYSRVDASGGLREVRIVADAGAADASVAA